MLHKITTLVFLLILLLSVQACFQQEDANTVQNQSTTTIDDFIVFNQGKTDANWNKGITAFDEAINYGECSNDDGAACPSIAWKIITDTQRGKVLEVSHSASGKLAGIYFGVDGSINLSSYSEGNIIFDVKVVSGDSNFTIKIDCVNPCSSGEKALGSYGVTDWETVSIPLTTLVTSGLDLTKVSTGLVIWASNKTNTIFLLDNVRFSSIKSDASKPSEPVDSDPAFIDYKTTAYGAGSISDTINPNSYRCVEDYGNWIYNAGVVEPAIAACNTTTKVPTGTPTKLYPHLTGVAKTKPTPSHKWWGSIPFMGEMKIGDPNSAAYITPDPITARISTKGARVMGIPSGLSTTGDGFLYSIPDPFSEVFDGIAIANSLHGNLKAFLKDYSDGSVTIEWQNNTTPVMEATFIHGSPYIYFKAYDGDLVIRTLRADGGEKGIFYSQNNNLGVWTSVAGNHNNFLISGEGTTTFSNPSSNSITVSNTAKALTLTLLPQTSGTPSTMMTNFFANKARAVVKAVHINYSVNRSTNTITVNHEYKDDSGNNIETIVGMHPLHWKNSTQTTSAYSIRSGRGTIKFSQSASFSYQLPFVGVLPTLPTLSNTFDLTRLQTLIKEFIAKGSDNWNQYNDAYWSGKIYNKVAELTAIADSIGMAAEAMQLRNWLKTELADWFTAETNGKLDVNKYFAYDKEWNTLLAMEESFMSHQQLNDHHFHYGYLIRAAVEVCRTDVAWCGSDQYGPMIELLIRDYAGGRNDAEFPYLRNFDPANGFSWASGKVNFVRGNNNESASEAANSYGAIILYGLITNNNDLVERGMYLHASTSAAYWEYWNNIDGYRNVGAAENNFPTGYNKITTSIIWGDGGVFSTWFSPAFAHILGIQGLPTNPLVLHIGLHADYLVDYVNLGLSQSSNGKPSGLPNDQWRDIWWNIWSMTNGSSAIADYNTVADYEPEEGESKAHTYHWIHTFNKLGHIKTGTGTLTSNSPTALAFENNGVMTYVVYNFSDVSQSISFSDGQTINAAAKGFTILTK